MNAPAARPISPVSSDVSRTYPVNGKFTERQKQLYNIVLKGLEVAESMSKPGQLKNELQQILFLTDNVEVLSENFTNKCYKNRNRQLTENADFCICFYNEKRQRCGTAQTVRMAEKKGMTVVNLYR